MLRATGRINVSGLEERKRLGAANHSIQYEMCIHVHVLHVLWVVF